MKYVVHEEFNIDPREILRKYNKSNPNEIIFKELPEQELIAELYSALNFWLPEQDDILFYPFEKDKKAQEQLVNEMMKIVKEESNI